MYIIVDSTMTQLYALHMYMYNQDNINDINNLYKRSTYFLDDNYVVESCAIS